MLNQSFLSLWKLKELRSIQLIVCQCFRRHLTAAAPAAAANPIAGHSFPPLIFFCFWFCFDQSSKKHFIIKKTTYPFVFQIQCFRCHSTSANPLLVTSFPAAPYTDHRTICVARFLVKVWQIPVYTHVHVQVYTILPSFDILNWIHNHSTSQ